MTPFFGEGLHGYDDLAEHVALFQMLMGGKNFLQREHSIDHRFEAACEYVP